MDHAIVDELKMNKRNTVGNKNYMSIAVSMLKRKFPTRHNSGGVGQENAPQSATAYS